MLACPVMCACVDHSADARREPGCGALAALLAAAGSGGGGRMMDEGGSRACLSHLPACLHFCACRRLALGGHTPSPVSGFPTLSSRALGMEPAAYARALVVLVQRLAGAGPRFAGAPSGMSLVRRLLGPSGLHSERPIARDQLQGALRRSPASHRQRQQCSGQRPAAAAEAAAPRRRPCWLLRLQPRWQQRCGAAPWRSAR